MGVRFSNGLVKWLSGPFEYSGDLNSELVWILNSPKEVGLQMVWITNGIWNPEALPFEIRTYGCHFVKNHLKSIWTNTSGFWMVWFSIGWDLSIAWPFENQTTWSLTFKKSRIEMILDLKWSDFWSPLYWTFWTTNRLFSVRFSDNKFQYQTIWKPDTNLTFEYQTSLVFRW